MIYLEFKDRRRAGFEKIRCARVIARIISEMKWIRKVVRCEDPQADIDYKVIFK